MSSTSVPQFKVLIVGNDNVGKTSYTRCLKNKAFETEYNATMDVEVEKINIKTSDNQLIGVNIWDCAGNEKFQGLGSGYYVCAHAAIIMFDVKSLSSYKSVSYWYKLVREVCPNIPIVLCGNKVDGNYRSVRQEKVTFHNKVNIPYFEISVKMVCDCLEPFLYISRFLINKKISCITIPITEDSNLVFPNETDSIEWIDENEYDDFYETMIIKKVICTKLLKKITKNDFKENLIRTNQGLDMLSFIKRSCDVFNLVKI